MSYVLANSRGEFLEQSRVQNCSRHVGKHYQFNLFMFLISNIFTSIESLFMKEINAFKFISRPRTWKDFLEAAPAVYGGLCLVYVYNHYCTLAYSSDWLQYT